jgi:23S rRNA (uracil1939-C5)-methyltransferase
MNDIQPGSQAAPPSQLQRKPRPGDRLEVTIEKLVFGGWGIGRREGDGFVIFVEGAAPGERIVAEVFRRQKNRAEARVAEILSPAPSRIAPRCPIFGKCGGCSWQHINYDEQLRWKDAQVRESLERLGGLRNLPEDFWRQPVAAPSPWFYRNKMDFGFGTDRDTGATVVGMHRKGSFRAIIDAERCFIHPEVHDQVLGVFRDFAREHGLAGYNTKTHEGYLRNLIVRRSEAEGKSLIMLLTAQDDPLPGGGIDALAERLEARGVRLAGLIHGLNAGLADNANFDRELARRGDDFFFERLDDKQFRVSIFSFFQTNTRGAEKLYGVVRDRANLSGGEVVLDAFCGTGTIGIFLGDRAAQVYGVELVPEAVEDARRNAALNGLDDRCEFRAGDARHLIPALDRELRAQRGGQRGVDLVVVDPPRGGMHQKALESLLAIEAPRFLYVSCNPATLARDAVEIIGAGYEPRSATTVDMFPQTYHVEAVVEFEKTK